MDEKYKATLKSAETEDWLDLHVIRPLCYYLAVIFAKFDIHPNTVTIASMFIGAGSAIFFGCASYHYCGWNGLMLNLVAIVLLMIADIFDCTDGQLARMTGKKSGDSTSTTTLNSHGSALPTPSRTPSSQPSSASASPCGQALQASQASRDWQTTTSTSTSFS